MRRSPALAPLSRDHHRALAMAQEMVRADQHDAGSVAARFVDFLSRHELAHFKLEETLLLPPLAATRKELADRVLEEHESLRSAMRRLADPSSAGDLALLRQTGVLLRDHVRMEERELFPYLEETLGVADLEDIGARIDRGA